MKGHWKPFRTLWWWPLALAVSLVAHAMGFFALPAQEQAVKIEGGAQIEIAMLGSAFENARAAGDVSETLTAVKTEPVVEVDTAEALKPVNAEAITDAPEASPALEAVPTPLARTVQTETPAQPKADQVTPAKPTAAKAVEELTPATEAVSPIASTTAAQPAKATPVKPALQAVKPERIQAETPVEPKREVVKPVKKTAEKKPPKKTKAKKAKTKKKTESKVAKKRPAKKAKGTGGKNRKSARKGEADGKTAGRAAKGKSGNRRASTAGNAAVTNYPGKVQRKVARAAKRARSSGRGVAVVSFTVSSGGQVGGIRLTKSTGNARLDKVAVSAVKRAAPFPPIPKAAGKRRWAFRIPIHFR